MQSAGLEIDLYSVFYSRHAGLLRVLVAPMGQFSTSICESRLITAGVGEACYVFESHSCN